jgi:hypothetical protein
MSVSSLSEGAVLRGRTTLCAPSSVFGVVGREFFWIFRGFTDCAAELTFAQHLGFGCGRSSDLFH